jgi:glutamate dehydrogenase
MSSKTEKRAASGPAPVAAVAKALVAGSLPGELDGFGPSARSAAAEFVLGALTLRKPGQVSMSIDTLAGSEGRRRMRLAIVNDDMPFLVDSVAAILSSKGLVIDRLLHPVVSVDRDPKGALERFGSGPKSESVIYVETDRADARDRSEIRDSIVEALADVRNAVGDWESLKSAMHDDAGQLEGEEQALLQWLVDNNFTLLGHALSRE